MFCLIKQIEFHNYNDGIPGVVAIKQMHRISDRSGVRWSMHIFIDFNRTWLSSTLHLKKYLVYLNPLRETAYHVFRCGTREIHQSFILWGYSVFMKFLNNMLKVFNVLSYSVRVYASDFNTIAWDACKFDQWLITFNKSGRCRDLTNWIRTEKGESLKARGAIKSRPLTWFQNSFVSLFEH